MCWSFIGRGLSSLPAWQHFKGAQGWQHLLLGIRGTGRDLLRFVLQSRPSVMSTMFFDIVTGRWTFTSGLSSSGNLWTFTFWSKFPRYSKKQKITRTNSGVLDGSKAPFYKDYHSGLPAAENRTTYLLGSFSRRGDLCRGVGEALSLQLSQEHWWFHSYFSFY